MATMREQVLEALKAVLQTSAEFKTVSRRLEKQENITPDMSPALFVVTHQDAYTRPVIAAPPKRDLTAMAIIYNNVGTGVAGMNAIPEAPINDAIDAMDALLKGDNPLVKKNTLGGLVEACFIEGTILRGSGDVDGLASAFIPIRIILP